MFSLCFSCPWTKPNCTVSLPDEIIEKILSYVPVKQLLRMKCVCKQWNQIISHMPSRSSRSDGFLCIGYKGINEPVILPPTNHQREVRIMEFSHYLQDFSNGFVLYPTFSPHRYVLAHPMLPNQAFLLPQLPLRGAELTYFVLGLAVVGSEFYVVVIIYERFLPYGISWIFEGYKKVYKIMVFSSRTKRWERQPCLLRAKYIEQFYSTNRNTESLFCKGAIHRISREYMIVYFVAKRNLKFIKLPTDMEPDDITFMCRIGESDSCLGESEGRLRYYRLEYYSERDGQLLSIWELDDNYYKDFTICGSSKWQLKNVVCFPWFRSIRSFLYDEDFGIIYYLLDNTISSYSLETKKLSKLYSPPNNEDCSLFSLCGSNKLANLSSYFWR